MNYIVTRNKEFFENVLVRYKESLNIGDGVQLGLWDKPTTVQQEPSTLDVPTKFNYCSFEEMSKNLPLGIAVDTETTGLDARKNKIFAVQFGTGKDNYLIDLQDYSTSLGLKEWEGKTIYLTEVLPLLEKRHLVFHNAMFDLGFLMTAGFVPDLEYIWDTLIASRILYNGKQTFRHDFGSVMKRELGLAYDKTEQKNIHKIRLSTPQAIQYCFNDVDRLKDLHKHLYDKLRSYGGHQAYNNKRRRLCPLVYLELCGIPICKYSWQNKMNIDEADFKVAQQAVIDYIWEHLPQYRAGDPTFFDTSKKVKVLLTSPKQMIAVFKNLGINTQTDDKKTGGKKDSIEEGVLSLSKHEFVPIWLKFKDASHRVNNFGKNILGQIEDGRIYVRLNPMVDTGRISSRTGRKKGEAQRMNPLNVPSDGHYKKEDPRYGITRKAFKANKGYKFVVCDFAGQENVILADVSQDAVMLASVINGADLHCSFARLVFPELAGLTDEEIISKHKDKRTFVKSPRFAFAYGGTAFTVSKASGMPIKQAEELEDKFKELHEGVFGWGKRMFEQAIEVGYIESVDHWRLHLPYYSEFRELQRKIDSMSKEARKKYKQGKAEYKAQQEREEQIRDAKKLIKEVKAKGDPGKKELVKLRPPAPYIIQDEEAYEVYMEWRMPMRKYHKMRSEYQRLCLNSPIQTCGSHMTQLAEIELYKYIVSRGHLWKARLVNEIYDEICMEVTDDLAEEYKEVLGRIMRESADHYLTSGLVKMGADAEIGSSWFEAK